MKTIMEDQEFERNVLEDNNAKIHKPLNFYLPHEFGGCGTAYQQDLYGKFNVYTENHDLATIKPRWTTQNEFRVELPRNDLLDEDEDDIQPDALLTTAAAKKQSSIGTHDERMKYCHKFQNKILEEFYKNELPDLEEQLLVAQRERDAVEKEYLHIKKIKGEEFNVIDEKERKFKTMLAKMKREKMEKLRKKWFYEWKKRTNFKKRDRRRGKHSKSGERSRTAGSRREDRGRDYQGRD